MKYKYSNLDFTPKEINEQSYTIRAVFSTGDVDRHGEIVDQKSWILDDFMKNPVVLFGHDHYSPPVGKIVGLGYNSEGNLEGEVKFAAEEYPFAKVIWNLYKGGFMKAFSVGFSAGKVDVVDDRVILKDNTLYEISTVGVPANAMALAKSKGLNVQALEDKFLEVEKSERERLEEKSVETIAEVVAENCKDCGKAVEKDCPCNNKPVEEAPIVEPVVETVPAEPVVETTTTETTEEKSIVEKGEVADEMSDMDEREKKWKNMEAVYDIFGAFARVYYDDSTPAEDFNKLLKETGELFIKYSSGSDDSTKAIEEFSKGIKTSLIDLALEQNEKSGRVLSKDNRSKVESAVEALQKVLDADTKKEDDTKTISENTTDFEFIKVETPAVRISIPKKGKSKGKMINKAIRRLLAEKRTN